VSVLDRHIHRGCIHRCKLCRLRLLGIKRSGGAASKHILRSTYRSNMAIFKVLLSLIAMFTEAAYTAANYAFTVEFIFGSFAAPVNWNGIVFTPRFATFKKIVHSLEPDETPSNSHTRFERTDGHTHWQTNRQTDRPTDWLLHSPSQTLKNAKFAYIWLYKMKRRCKQST